MGRQLLNPTQSAEANLAPEQWVDAYGDQLFGYAYKILRDPHAAEEVVQEALLAGVKNYSDFSGEGSQIGWLSRILRRKAIDFLRKQTREKLADDVDPAEHAFDTQGNWQAGSFPDASRLDSVSKDEFWEVMQKCLSKLPTRTASAFLMRSVDNLEVKQIASELEMTESNVAVRLHRARLSLAKCVGANWLDSPANLIPKSKDQRLPK